jgi:hypothetical protein
MLKRRKNGICIPWGIKCEKKRRGEKRMLIFMIIRVFAPHVGLPGGILDGLRDVSYLIFDAFC